MAKCVQRQRCEKGIEEVQCAGVHVCMCAVCVPQHERNRIGPCPKETERRSASRQVQACMVQCVQCRVCECTVQACWRQAWPGMGHRHKKVCRACVYMQKRHVSEGKKKERGERDRDGHGGERRSVWHGVAHVCLSQVRQSPLPKACPSTKAKTERQRHVCKGHGGGERVRHGKRTKQEKYIKRNVNTKVGRKKAYKGRKQDRERERLKVR